MLLMLVQYIIKNVMLIYTVVMLEEDIFIWNFVMIQIKVILQENDVMQTRNIIPIQRKEKME